MLWKTHFPVLALSLVVAASAPADIVWSGEQNLTGFEQFIDLNGDSLTDVLLYYAFAGDPSVETGRIAAKVDGSGVDGSNRILVALSDGRDAALPFGTLISGTPDPSREWGGGTFFSGTVSSWVVYNPDFPGPPLESDEEWRGLLGENGNTYIGIEFEVQGATHYGWVNIALGSETFHHDFRDPITTSWAYESTPGAAITAGAIPEPSTGILTTVGSLSLLMLARARRRRKQGRTPVPRCHAPQAPPTPDEW